MKIKTKIRRYLLLPVCFGLIPSAAAQESGSVFNFLNLPVSAHSTALGGKNISLVEDDISLAIQNPALLTGVSNHTVGFSFMTYMQGCNTGAAAYSQQVGERGAWGANVQFVGYGSTKETLLSGEIVGEFKPLLGHAPIRISVTMVDLTRWTSDDYFTTGSKLKSGSIFINHFVLGAEFLPSDKFYIGLGYNFRRGYEMTAAGSSHAAGLSFGGGVNLKRLKLGIAYAKYHVSAPTLAFTLAYNFAKTRD